jgi:transcriptional regulator GlxA family with amidase domain
MSDANQACRLLGSCIACRAVGRASAPRVVLVAAAALEECVAGCLSRQRRQQELMDAVRKLADTAQADATSSPNLPRGGMAFGVLRRVREHIEHKLADKVSLRELAVIAGLSAGHFSRAFRQSVGVSPHRYLQQRRVATAADLIRSTNRPLVEIALSVGFSDQSHFTRVFARARGETPTAFRRRHR